MMHVKEEDFKVLSRCNVALFSVDNIMSFKVGHGLAMNFNYPFIT